MTEHQWTPGPWSVVRVGNDEGPRTLIKAGWPPKDNVAIFAIGDSLQWAEEANAHLIAAAPDMAEALHAFVDEYVEMVNSGDAGFWNPEEEPKVIAARAALKKARGES